MPAALNGEALTGLLVTARPLVLECLVDPRHRGAKDGTRVAIKSTVSGGKIEHAVSGDNMTPDGERCVRAALDGYLSVVPGWASKLSAVSEPVTAEVQVRHTEGVAPTVKLGVNEASDVAGTVRLAQGSACGCYAPWKSASGAGPQPRALKATIKVVRGAAPQASFVAVSDPAAQEVAACLQEKIGGLKVQTKSNEVDVPYAFYFIHSNVFTPLAGAPPDLQFQQADALRNRVAAESVIALGGRTNAAQAYDALVKKFKAAPQSVPLADLQQSCAALLAADDQWGQALSRQLEIDKRTLSIVQELKASDPSWGEAATAAQRTVGATEQDIATAKQMRASDAESCPKER
jgi:hypothetical protein